LRPRLRNGRFGIGGGERSSAPPVTSCPAPHLTQVGGCSDGLAECCAGELASNHTREKTLPTPRLAAYDDRLSAHIGFLFTEFPLARRFAEARRAGFHAVEHPNPFSAPARQLERLLSDAGLTFVQAAFPTGDPTRGEKGLAALPTHVDSFRSSVEPTLDYLEEIGCRLAHVMAGNRPPGVSQDRLWGTFLDNLAFAAEAATKRGLGILIEPIGPTTPNYIIDKPQLAVDAIRTLGHPNIGILMDVFHAISVDCAPVELILKHADIIHHVHIADFPGRHEPGSGTIEFDSIFEALDTIAYRGFVGCEYRPLTTTEASFGWRTIARQITS
jgi:hydroxypyruvate isomerase